MANAIAMKYHEAADAFPMMGAERFAELKADIKQHGLRESITVCDDKVLDGRNRHKACKELGIEPAIKTFDAGDPWAYVWSLNGQRRDLSAEVRAAIWLECNVNGDYWRLEREKIRAAAAEKLSKAARERPRKDGKLAEKASRGSDVPTATNNRLRKAQAKAAGVSESVIAKAAALRNKSPNLDAAVRKGEMTPAAAHRKANETKAKKQLDAKDFYDDSEPEPSKARLSRLIKLLVDAEELCLPGIKELTSVRGTLNKLRRALTTLEERRNA